MPRQLREWLEGNVNRVTAIPSAIGFMTLGVISLALPDLRNPHEWLKFVAQFQNSTDALAFFGPKLPPLFLIIVTIWWYYRYKDAVLNELSQIDRAFEENSSPRFYGNLFGYKIIPLVGYALVVTYMALVLAAPYIWLYCLIALALHITDITGSSLTMQNLSKTFSRFPVSEAPEARLIAEHREVLRQYYYENYTLPRIGVLLIVTAASLVYSLALPQGLTPAFHYAPYAVMIANIVIGELVIQRWRNVRDGKLNEIAQRQDDLTTSRRASGISPH